MKQSELIGTFSHELRNPLTLINSSLQLLEAECPAVLNCSLWTQIRRDMADVLHLLNDMSSLNKSGHVHLSALSLSGFLAELASSFYPAMEEKGILFTVSLAPSLSDVSVSADPLKLKEAVTNLLLNAMDAVSESEPESEPEPEPSLKSKPNSKSEPMLESEPMLKGKKTILLLAERFETADILIHIRDNGPGIPAEYMETLFDPFVTHKPHGTGLGLSIVKNIVREHGGSIHVHTCTSLPDSYTDFCVRLPMAES